MNIALLEWICGSGLFSVRQADQTLFELLDEGWHMLTSTAQILSRSGCNVTLPIETSIFESKRQEWNESDAGFVSPVSSLRDYAEAEQRWIEIAAGCDAALIIAPEIDGTLEQLLATFENRHIPTWNCRSDFLRNTCDKSLTAQCLANSEILHPPTIRLSQLDRSWIDSCHKNLAPERWILKPTHGAGCDELMIVDDPSRFPTDLLPLKDDLLVQPFIEGNVFSGSALVTSAETWHWLPLGEQRFEPALHGQFHSLKYLTTEVLSPGQPRGLPDTMRESLKAAFGKGAFAWVGTDWVQSRDGNWWLIECNPRFTTSVLQFALEPMVIDYFEKLNHASSSKSSRSERPPNTHSSYSN